VGFYAAALRIACTVMNHTGEPEQAKTPLLSIRPGSTQKLAPVMRSRRPCPGASRPASIRTCPGPQARCQMGSLVLVGRCYLCGGLGWTKSLNAVCPIATVMLYFDASQCSHSSHATIGIPRNKPFPRVPLAPTPPSDAYCSQGTQGVVFGSPTDQAHSRYLMGLYYGTWPWMREFVNVNRLGLPAVKLWAYDHLCLFGWPVPLPTSDDRSFIY
jgi:hypothetical protein